MHCLNACDSNRLGEALPVCYGEKGGGGGWCVRGGGHSQEWGRWLKRMGVQARVGTAGTSAQQAVVWTP